MSSVIPARRRAERFDALVDGHGAPGADAPRWDDLLALVGEIRALPEVAPRPEFTADLRSRLMAEADTVLLPLERELALSTRTPTATRHRRRLTLAVGALTFVGATVGVGAAAQQALPGDSLYPVKRALENAETGLASGAAKTEGILDNATLRLDEVAELAEDDTPEHALLIADTLEDFAAQAQDGADRALESGDEEQLTELRSFTEQSMASLEELDGVVPDSARDELAAAALVIAEIDRLAFEQCPTCGDNGVVDLPTVFLTADQTTLPGTTAPGSRGESGERPQDGTTGDQAGTDSDSSDDGPLPSPDPGDLLPSPDSDDGPIEQLTDGVDDLLPGDSSTSSGPLDPVTSGLGDTTDGLGNLVGGAVDGTVDDLLGG